MRRVWCDSEWQRNGGKLPHPIGRIHRARPIGTIVPISWRREQEADECLETFADGLAGGFDSGVGLTVESFAAPQDAAKIAHGLAALGDGAPVALLEDTGHVLFGLGAKKNCEAIAKQLVKSAGIGDDAATRSQDESLAFSKDGIEGFAFHAAVSGEAVEIEDDGEGEAGSALNFPVEFDEGQAYALRQQRTERGFASATQPDERDAGTAGGDVDGAKFFEKKFVGVTKMASGELLEESSGLIESGRRGLAVDDQILDGNIEHTRNLVQANDGNVAASQFDVSKKARGERGLARQLSDGQTAARADGANVFAELLQVGVYGGAGLRDEGAAARMPARALLFSFFLSG